MKPESTAAAVRVNDVKPGVTAAAEQARVTAAAHQAQVTSVAALKADEEQAQVTAGACSASR